MKPRGRYLVGALKLLDLLFMVVAFILAAVLLYVDVGTVSFSKFLTLRIKVQNVILFSGFLLLWHTSFSYFKLYTPDRVCGAGWREMIDIGSATLWGTLVIALSAIVVKIELISLISLTVFCVAAFSMSVLSRVAFGMFLKWRRSTRSDLAHLVIIGTNRRAVAQAKRIESHPELGYRLVGFVDEHWAGNLEFRQMGYSIVSDYDSFQSFLKDNVVDEVILCTPVKSFYDRCSQILKQCEEQGITVRFMSDLFTRSIGRSKVEKYEEQILLTGDGRKRDSAVLIKRLLDFLLSLTLLVTLSPLLLIIGLANKLNSPGTILFVQERVGLNKRRFHLYKFRTMVVDAEQQLAALAPRNEVSGPVFKIRDDPRITTLGRFLRKSSLDELPQLFNVLKGDMSLVGPRPLSVRDYRGVTEDWHRRRISVRPGITCLWQIGGRSSIPFERWMELDMEYIDQWSLILDLKILLRTIPAVLKASGAS